MLFTYYNKIVLFWSSSEFEVMPYQFQRIKKKEDRSFTVSPAVKE